MKVSSDQVFVFLGFIAGSNVGTASVLALLPERTYSLGGYFITASATLMAAIVAALMVRHQLVENYRNQRRLELVKYASNTENQKALIALHDELGRVRSMLYFIHFRDGKLQSTLNFKRDIYDISVRTIRKNSVVLAPVSSLYYRSLRKLLSSVDEAVARALDYQDVEEWIKEDRDHLNEIGDQIHRLILAETQSVIFNTEWTKLDSRDWKVLYQSRL